MPSFQTGILQAMQTANLPFDVTPSALLPPPLHSLIRPIEPALLRHFLPDRLCRGYTASNPASATAQQFTTGMLRHLDIGYKVDAADLERIPATGPCVVVANHPYGLLEGFILVTLLEKIRPDYRIVANTLLASTPALHERVIFVNPFEDAGHYENGRGLRASLECLRKGGLLVMFPAGEVSHFSWAERGIADPPWNSAAARFARKIGCPTLPLFFKGANSLPFQMLGTIHPRLRTLNLARELVKKSKRIIDVRVGTAIAASVLNSYPDAAMATEYLRARTHLLDSRAAASVTSTKTAWRATASKATAVRTNEAEIAELGGSRILASNAGFKVVIAGASEIPNTLQEIGLAREQTFREIGEGTGNAFDLDQFDSYYRHMILWSNHDQRVAGAYRLTTTPEVLAEQGIKGLYTSTLFHYQPSFFHQMGPAIELGRSFIRREYQKHYAPLLLLWKGIGRFAQQHPCCPVLFGAVSISSGYQELSRALIVDFLTGQITGSLADAVKPRREFRPSRFVPKPVRQLSHLLTNVEELSASIQDLEHDGKGLPVLMRQYIKLGGQMLAFNVDPKFSNALDALVIADLRSACPAMLDWCMGRVEAAEFRAFHASACCV